MKQIRIRKQLLLISMASLAGLTLALSWVLEGQSTAVVAAPAAVFPKAPSALADTPPVRGATLREARRSASSAALRPA